MRRILEVDIANRLLSAEAGCPNLALTRAVEEHGLHFAPDPSSQTVCSLGGNINENSGGPHTLKYGVTADHILELTLVDPYGEVRVFGSRVGAAPWIDPICVIVGSEGTAGVVTEATVRLTPIPRHVRTALAAFQQPRDATETVSEIIASGVIPAAMEFMDGVLLRAVEDAFHAGLPTEAGALLLVECDGDDLSQVEDEIATAVRIAKSRGAVSLRIAETENERAHLWLARKKGIGAVGRLAPSMVTHDGVIPRSKLPEVLEFVYETAARHGVRVANIFHAGDGNLHPIFLFDDRDEAQVERVVAAGEEVIRKCLAEGGSVSGEHGIGVEKIDLLAEMFNADDMELQEDVRRALNDNPLCNPGKVLPSQKSCVEVRVRRRAAN
jgi:glycolate oxidase subunit GlcD